MNRYYLKSAHNQYCISLLFFTRLPNIGNNIIMLINIYLYYCTLNLYCLMLTHTICYLFLGPFTLLLNFYCNYLTLLCSRLVLSIRGQCYGRVRQTQCGLLFLFVIILSYFCYKNPKLLYICPYHNKVTLNFSKVMHIVHHYIGQYF